MKKTLMKCVAVATFAFASMNAMAQEAIDATVTLEPISALSLKANVADPVGDSTIIHVINYSTTNTIYVTFPGMKPVPVTHETSATYKRAGYKGPTHVYIQGEPSDSNPGLPWSKDVGYQNDISLYLRKVGWYVYDSQT